MLLCLSLVSSKLELFLPEASLQNKSDALIFLIRVNSALPRCPIRLIVVFGKENPLADPFKLFLENGQVALTLVTVELLSCDE